MTVVNYTGKRIKVTDEIQIANPLTLKWEDFPELARWAQCNHKALLSGRGRQKTEPETWPCEKEPTWPPWLCRYNRRESGAKECRQPLEAGKGNEMDSPRSLLKGHSSADAFMLVSPVRPILDFSSPELQDNTFSAVLRNYIYARWLHQQQEINIPSESLTQVAQSEAASWKKKKKDSLLLSYLLLSSSNKYLAPY